MRYLVSDQFDRLLMITGNNSVKPISQSNSVYKRNSKFIFDFTSIVAQPPDIYGVLFLFFLEKDDSVHQTFWQFVSIGISA
jgi:hypothetical protein